MGVRWLQEPSECQAVETPFGWVVIAGSLHGVSLVSLPFADWQTFENELGGSLRASLVKDESGPLKGLCDRIRSYYEGRIVIFAEKLDFGLASPFEKAVWNATGSIPYGEIRTYAWVANQIGRPQAYRAVGQALGRNPCAVVVPCHRVIAADGSLGGFSAGLGLKKRLLDLEAGSRAPG